MHVIVSTFNKSYYDLISNIQYLSYDFVATLLRVLTEILNCVMYVTCFVIVGFQVDSLI